MAKRRLLATGMKLPDLAGVTASSIQGEASPQQLFDNDGDTAWETKLDDRVNALDLDLGERKSVSSLSLAERGQRVYWNHVYNVELKVRDSESSGWQSILKHTGTLGGPSILDFPPVTTRYLRLELGKTRPQPPLQVSELRLFPPLEEE